MNARRLIEAECDEYELYFEKGAATELIEYIEDFVESLTEKPVGELIRAEPIQTGGRWFIYIWFVQGVSSKGISIYPHKLISWNSKQKQKYAYSDITSLFSLIEKLLTDL